MMTKQKDINKIRPVIYRGRTIGHTDNYYEVMKIFVNWCVEIHNFKYESYTMNKIERRATCFNDEVKYRPYAISEHEDKFHIII